MLTMSPKSGCRWSYRVREARREDGPEAIESPELELSRLREDNARLGSTKRTLIAALVVVLITAAGVAAWLIIDNAGTTVERDIAALIDNYYAAWEADDPQAEVDLLTDDATLLANNGNTYSGPDSITAFVGAMQGFHPEQIGDPMILAPTAPSFSGWFVATHTFAPDFPEFGDIRELELFMVVEQDGKYLIQVHETWLAGE